MREVTAIVVIVAIIFSAYAGYSAWPWWCFLISSGIVLVFHGLALHIQGNHARQLAGMPSASFADFMKSTA